MISPPKVKQCNRTFRTALALILGVPLLLWCAALYIAA